MVITSLPPGFRFHPTDVELVKYYLKRKVLGKKFPIDAIAEVDIYKFPPWDLRDQACLRKDLKWYFFCPRERKYATGGRTNRSTDCGFWKTTGKDRPVIYNGQPVGMIKSLIFHRQVGERKSERTDWVMHEYRLEDEDLKTQGVAQDAFVICMIYQKDGRGPRNGAQYGAPYDEEEWDDNEEADVPSTSSLARAFCGGSASKACLAGPSQIVPSVVNVPPPALRDDVAMEDPQNLCDEYLLSHGMFGDEIPAASAENDKVENLDHINPDGNHQAECTVDDIFDGLEDFDGSLDPYRHHNNFSVSHSDIIILPPCDAFMELKDFDAPLTSVNGPGPSGQNHSDRYPSAYYHSIAAQSSDFDAPLTSVNGPGLSGSNHSDRYPSAYDHSIAAQSFWTPVIPDDANAAGLGLKDLEIPLACFGEATQSNQAYVDTSFCDLGGNGGLGGFGTSTPVFTQPFHGSEATHIAEDLPWLSQGLQLEPFEGYVDNLQEGYGVEECTNQEIVRYGAGAAASPIYNLDLGCGHPCENSGRGEETIFCCMLRFLEYPAHPSSAVERPAPNTGAKRSDGHALFLLYGDSSFHVKAEVTLGGGGCGCTNDALSRGLEGFPVVTGREENGSGLGKGAANCGCGILSSLVLLALSGYHGVLAVRACIIGDLPETFRLLILDVVWLIEPISVWCACIEPSVSSVFLFVFYAYSLPFIIHCQLPMLVRNLLSADTVSF